MNAWRRRLWMRLRALARGRSDLRRLDEEIRFHLDQQIAEYVAAGMDPEQARSAALRAFGNPAALREQAAEAWGWLRLEQLLRAIRNAARALRRTPRFAGAAVLVTALGIGAATALFTVVRSVLLSPLPFREPGRLVRLYEHSSDDRNPYSTSAAGVFAEWKEQNRSFEELAIYSDEAVYNVAGTGAQPPEKVRAAECSANLFRTLGVQPALGRAFTAADDRPEAGATVLLSWSFWKRRFAGDPAILRQTIRLNAKPYTVIGVMPPGFAYPAPYVQLWTPVFHEEPAEEMQALDSHDFAAIGRLKPGVSEAAAGAELSLIVKRLHDEHLDNPFVSKAAASRPLLEAMVGDVKTPLYALLAATGCLLLIACLNVAGLLVAREAARRKELAVRAALGGSRFRLLAEHLAESLLLWAAGGLAGLLLAWGLVRWFVTTRPEMSRVEAIRVDGWALAFAAALVGLCAVLVGGASALSVRGDRLLAFLHESSRSCGFDQTRVRLRRCLLSLEVGLTVVLLVGAGLMLKSYQRLRTTALGCATENVLTLRLALPEASYGRSEDRVRFFTALLERARALPGVAAAGFARVAPGQGYGGDSGFAVAEHPTLPTGKLQSAMVRWADPGYFGALGIPLLEGRTFDENQQLEKGDQVVISESLVRLYFPGEDPIGKHLLTLGNRLFRVVGVVGDVRYLVPEPPQPTMYFPLYASLYGGVATSGTLVLRAVRDADALAVPVERIVQQLDPQLPVSDVLTMDEIVGKSTAEVSFDAALLLAFALSSLVLAAAGLFGVLSYVATHRTTEIGVRIALGAQRGELLRMMLADGLRPAGAGLVAGLFVAAVGTRWIRGLLYGLPPLDAPVYAAVAVLLALVAGASCLLPALRASRLDPMRALRNE